MKSLYLFALLTQAAVSSAFAHAQRVAVTDNIPSKTSDTEIASAHPMTFSYNPQNEMFAPRKTKRSLLKNETLLKSPFPKNFRPGFAGGWGCPGSVFEWPPNTVRRPFFFSLFRFGSLRDRFIALRSHSLAQRFVRGHALRFDDQSAEGQPRADIRARIRSIVTRIRARHAATRNRVDVAAIDHTASGSGIPICITEVCGGASVETADRSHIHI